MRLCVSITILMVFEMLFIAKSKACSKCSCLAKNFEFVASYTKIALVSSEYTENTTGLMKCAWVVKAQNSSHSVTFKMSQVLTTKSSFCGEDYVFIRDGSSGRGPPLGYWCKDGTYDTEVTSYSNAIHVELETYSNGVAGLIFVMSFWESSVNGIFSSTDTNKAVFTDKTTTGELELNSSTNIETHSDNTTLVYDNLEYSNESEYDKVTDSIITSEFEISDYELTSEFSDYELTTENVYSVISGSSVQYGPIEYGIANYVLLAFSVLIGSLLLGAVAFLIYREYKKHQAEKEMKFREKLLMRRTGISGRSGGIINDDFRHDSVSDKNTSFIFLSPTPTSEISL